MTPKQEDHLDSIINDFVDRVSPKYEKGAIEHGGNLWQLSKSELLDCAIDEAIDQVVYLLTLRSKLK